MTVAVGNADAHGRNLSVLYDRNARPLAPLYDVVPTTSLVPAFGQRALDTDAAMRVNGVRSVLSITGTDLVAEAISWRVPTALARTLVETTVAPIADGALALAEELGVPDRAAATVTERCA